MSSEIEETISPDQIPIIQITENGIVGFEILCRLCANRSDNLISVYSEEGISNDLSTKMNLYLPVKVSENDSLPLQCCFQCASTVLTWHELVVASVEADRRLKDLLEEAERQLKEQNLQAGHSFKEVKVGVEANSVKDDESVVEPDGVKSKVVKRRGRATRGKAQNVKKETRDSKSVTDTTDGEWIKTELIFGSQSNDFYGTQTNAVEKTNLENTEDSTDYGEPNFDTSESVHKDEEMNIEEEHLIKVDSDVEECFEENPLETSFETEDKKTNEKKCKREYHCDFCSFVTKTHKELKQHMLNEHPNKIDQFIEIKRQKKRSKIDQDAVNKAKVVVNSRTYYHCNECGKNLHSPYTYIWHNRIHTGERPFVCDLCGKQFRVSQGLVRHLRETHAGIKNFPCDLCGRMFASRRNVEEHRRIHTNERPYICDLCGKSFKQKASLFVHNRSHNDTFPFRCSYCNQGFRTRPSLLVHVTRHTGEKPYACDVCGRCFRIKYELKRHRLIHSDEKPFSCTDCGQSFRQKRYLRNHNKINHNRITP